MKSVAVVAVVLGMLAAGFALFVTVAAVMRARGGRLSLRRERGIRQVGGPDETQSEWVYLPWRRVRPHHFGGTDHCWPGQDPPGGECRPGGHHGGGHHHGGYDNGSSWSSGFGGSGDGGGGGQHHG